MPFIDGMWASASHSSRKFNLETIMTKTTDISAVRKAKKSKPQQTPPSLSSQAPAWAGDLDVHALKGHVKGEPLFAALQNRARQLGHTLQDMCGYLGFSYPYYSQLRSGRRSLSGAADDFTLACACYLAVPRLTVLALADIISPQDMYESRDAVTVHLPRAFEQVCTDPYWAHLATENVRSSHSEAHYLIVRLYEQMSGLQLLPRAIAPQQLAESMAILQDIRANVQAAAVRVDAP